MPPALCGKWDLNPKKHLKYAVNDGGIEANARRIIVLRHSQISSVKLLKQSSLFSFTFFLDTASPRTYYAARKF
jgi:hypothetical protein